MFMKKTYYTIPKLNIAVLSAAGLMLLSAILRIIYYTGVRAAPGELWVQGVLPVCACLLFAVMIFTTASDRLYRTTGPVLMGCVVFAGSDPEQTSDDTEYKLAQTIAGFLGRHMEG